MAVTSPANPQPSLVVQKYGGTHGSGYHSIFITSDGKSSPFQVHENDKSNRIVNLLSYKEHFLSFMVAGPLVISKDKITLFTSKQKLRKNPAHCYCSGSNFNWNRNVRLTGDRLYFIDENSQLAVFDLATILSQTEQMRTSFEPRIIKGSFLFEEFCLDAKENIVALSANGLVARIPESGIQLDLSKSEYGQLGTQFGAIETLAGYIVVGSYCPTTTLRAFAVLDPSLKLLSFVKNSAQSSHRVQNMLLFVRQGMLHVRSGLAEERR